ncbi:hypothetical protein HYFRA_00007926 [Hymenoscyphus fraxineus]|uniref:Uncharacterized protein n=1 Tax=Hymenoscyphus fraxineus TaxID=746836 RepID=A0A9N9KS79_9HELO|nr:hypothetical protein HYFRA_00007926 [Hymenoscyphus fraxineus]
MNPPTQPRGAPLSITTTSQSQSSSSSSPPANNHSNFPSSPTSYTPSPISSTYSPLISHSQHPRGIGTQRRATEPPKSATSSFSSSPSSPLRFFTRNGVTESPTRMNTAPTRASTGNSGMNGEKIKRLSEGSRRYSGEKINVHTECGRHSDEWLFGPMKGAVRRILERGDSRDRVKEDKGKGRE